jgi:hypothetical protein
MTCLYSANSNTGQLKVVQTLAETIGREATDLEGHTALHHACMNERDHLCVMDCLIDSGIHIDSQDNVLFIAVQLTRLLLDR